MNTMNQDLGIKRKAIKQEIKTHRKASKIMWKELRKIKAYRGLANPEQKKYMDKLNDDFVKNEALLKNLHQKINREWLATDRPREHRIAAIICLFLFTAAMLHYLIQL